MRQKSKLAKVVVTAIALASALPIVTPVMAAQADVELLKSYVGAWKGRGTTTSSGNTETVVCKLDITSAGPAIVNYKGRCSLAGGNLSIAGSMAFVDERKRFEAVMSSNTNFSGVAIGRRRGAEGIDFQLKERDRDTNAEYSIDAGIGLKDGDITIDFAITEVASGKKVLAKVPFSK